MSRLVPFPRDSTCAVKASRSLSWSRVKACALVPAVGTPYRCRAARLDVAENPTMYAALAAATAASSWVRREPISMHGRPFEHHVIREAAEAIAESWLRIDSSRVSNRTASANVDSTTISGE